MLRRLTKDDSDLLREAYLWDEGRPQWYREADAVFNCGTADDLIAQIDDKRKIFVGVFDPDFTAVVIIEWKGDGLFEGHLLARRGTNLETVIESANYLMRDMLQFGMQEVAVWIAEKNRSVRRLCDSIGLLPDGVVMYKGSYRGRVIRWLRHSIRREQFIG